MADEIVQQIKSVFDEAGITKAITAINKYNKSVANAANSSKQLSAAGKALARIGQIASGIVLSRGLLNLGATFREATSDAFALEKAISEISTIADGTGRDFEGLADGVRQVSDSLGIDILDVAEAQYQVLSNQVVNAADSFDFLETAARLATATVSDNASAVNALSSILNSFELPAIAAEEAADQLFKTVELGRVRLSELGNILGRVTPLSASLGVSFEETTSAIAALTQVGIRAAEATTLLSNVQLKLIKPTETLQEAIESLGASNAQTLIQALGFQGALEALAGTTQGTASEFGELFGRVRAIRGALTLGAERAEEFKKVLEEVGVESEGTLDEAFEKVLSTNAKQVEVELNKIKNSFTETFGRGTVALINNVLGAVGKAEGVLQLLEAGAIAAAVGLGTYIAASGLAAVSSLTLIGAVTGVNAAFAALSRTIFGPLGLAVAAGAGIGAIALAFIQARDEAANQVQEIEKLRDDQVKANRRALDLEVKARREATDENIQDIQRLILAAQQGSEESAALAREVTTFGLGGLADEVEDRIRGFEDIIKTLRDTGIEAELAFLRVNDVAKDVAQEVDDITFENSLRQLDDVEKAFAQIQRAEDLQAKGRRQIADGDKDRGLALEQQGKALAAQAQRTAEASGNAAALAQIEQRRLRIVDQQTATQLLLSKRLEEEKKIADDALPTFRETTNELKKQADQLAKLTGGDAEIFTTDATREEVLAEFGGLGGEIFDTLQKNLEKLTLLNKENIISDEQLARARQDFENTFSGGTGNVAEVFAQQFDLAIDNINAAVQRLDPIAKQFFETQNIDISINTAGIANQVLQVNKELKDGQKGAEDFNRVTSNIAGQFTAIRRISGEAQGALFDQEGAGEAFDQFQQINRIISDLQRQAQDGGIEAIDTEAFARAVKLAEDLVTTTQETGQGQDFAQALEENIKGAVGGFKELALLDTVAIKNANARIDALQLFVDTNADVIGQTDRILQGESNITKELEKQARLRAQAPSTPAAQFFGGVLRRQSGGAVGADNIPVLANRGEGFLNAQAMRNFFPQVQAMNAGGRPQFRNQGGAVSTPSGDINVTINEAKTPTATGDAVIRSINQSRRRQTAALR